MSYAIYTIFANRASSMLELTIDYTIDPYYDPETEEVFENTSWSVVYTGTSGSYGDSGSSGSSTSTWQTIGLAESSWPARYTIDFQASNTFSGDAIAKSWTVIDAALATGAQTLAGTTGADILLSGSGDDLVRAGQDDDWIDGGEGEDVLHGDGGADQIQGGEGNDTLLGGGSADWLSGDAGDDTMIGGSGDDTYLVDAAGDLLIERRGEGNDTVVSLLDHTLAGTFENLLLAGSAVRGKGNALANIMGGNAGDNILDGRGGADTMRGFGGNDTYTVDKAGDRVLEAAGGGTDTVRARASYTLAAGQEIEVLRTSSKAGTAPIALTGNEFANTLIGNAGDNLLDGGRGADILHGRGGSDTFVFRTKLGSGNVDHLSDFRADDTIQLSRAVFSALGAGPLDDAAFKEVSAGALDESDRILYDRTTGVLAYDADGSGSRAAVRFAIVDTRAALAADDVLVV